MRRSADAQSGLRMCCSQTTEDRFSRVEAQIWYNVISICIPRRQTLSSSRSVGQSKSEVCHVISDNVAF